jgi:hypothetical protein
MINNVIFKDINIWNMEMNKLFKYNKYYTSSRLMGSDVILRRYLGLDDDFPVPLSISHGIDMQHTVRPFDIDNIEPLHWAYNNEIYSRSSVIKKSIKIPHPWMLIKHEQHNPIYPLLIIGPPPGIKNDIDMLEALKKNNIRSGHILIKKIKETERSEKFWNDKSFKVVTAGWRDEGFYYRLSLILNRYEKIYSATLSSAIFFAASIGLKSRFIYGYNHYHYEMSGFEKKINFDAQPPRFAAKLIADENDKDFSQFAKAILGNEYNKSKEDILFRYNDTLKSIESPVFCRQTLTRIEKSMAPYIVIKLNKPGFCNVGFKGIIKKNCLNSYAIKMNEVDMWLNGKNKTNFSYKQIPYVRDVTVPGYGIDDKSHIDILRF